MILRYGFSTLAFIVLLDGFLDGRNLFNGMLSLISEVSTDESSCLEIVVVVVFILHVVFDIHAPLIFIDISNITDQDSLQLGLETVLTHIEVRHLDLLFENFQQLIEVTDLTDIFNLALFLGV